MNISLLPCFCTITLLIIGTNPALTQHPARPIDFETTTDVFKVIQQMPMFPACTDMPDIPNNTAKYECIQRELTKYIQSQLIYPEAARKAGIEGRVLVAFIVEKDGTLTQIECIKDIGYGCCEEAIRLIETMNALPQRWTPGKQRGEPIRVLMKIPVIFKL